MPGPLKVVAISEDLQVFLDVAGKGYESKEYLMSDKADDFWEDELRFMAEDGQVSEKDLKNKGFLKDLRLQWATDREKMAFDEGNPSMHYGTAKVLDPNTWLIHFTDANPQDIINSGFRGRDLDILALTTHYKEGSHPGPYALAFRLSQVSGHGRDFGKYGKNAVLFKAKEAAEAYHYGDEENQVVFIAKTAYDMWPIYGDSDSLSLYGKEKNEGEILLCDRNKGCLKDFVQVIESGDWKKKLAEAQTPHLDYWTITHPEIQELMKRDKSEASEYLVKEEDRNTYIVSKWDMSKEPTAVYTVRFTQKGFVCNCPARQS